MMSDEAGGMDRLTFGRRLIVASNRLPLVLERTDEGWDVEGGSGGLVTAMSPILRKHGGCWVGWPGTVEIDDGDLASVLAPVAERQLHDLVPVPLTAEERDAYYCGFANEVLWPLLHDLQSKYRFAPKYWDAYRRVNGKFSRIVEGAARPGDVVWVHDYHLIGVAEVLRDRGFRAPVGFFLHTPFPPIDIFVKLPWRTQILKALLHYDLLGFQTARDQRNFLSVVRGVLPGATVRREGDVVTCRWEGRSAEVGVFPVGIDVQEFVDVAASDDVRGHRRRIRENFPSRDMILAVSRLDYTKGVPEQLRAFRLALERYPELRGAVSLVQVVVPSREQVPEYDQLKGEIERRVGEINGRFSANGWVPVHFLYRSLDRSELVAYYREADVALVGSLKDGMNLVAKEYCAADLDEDGVLVLSEFAGAAVQLEDGAVLVNPYDTVATAEALRRALTMDREERRSRMRRLRRTVRREDVHGWAESFIRATVWTRSRREWRRRASA